MNKFWSLQAKACCEEGNVVHTASLISLLSGRTEYCLKPPHSNNSWVVTGTELLTDSSDASCAHQAIL